MIIKSFNPREETDISKEIIALEKSALERWNHGDTRGYLDLYADDFVYFDPMTEKRMDGLEKITEYYKPVEGNINVTECEMVGPLVQAVENMALLTYNLRSVEGESVYHWNCTEVYRRDGEQGWKIIHSHWSLAKPEIK
jgi:ketosteroid isomerase-like protein